MQFTFMFKKKINTSLAFPGKTPSTIHARPSKYVKVTSRKWCSSKWLLIAVWVSSRMYSIPLIAGVTRSRVQQPAPWCIHKHPKKEEEIATSTGEGLHQKSVDRTPPLRKSKAIFRSSDSLSCILPVKVIGSVCKLMMGWLRESTVYWLRCVEGKVWDKRAVKGHVEGRKAKHKGD